MQIMRTLLPVALLCLPVAVAAQDTTAVRDQVASRARVRIHSPLDGLSEHEWLTGIVVHSTEDCTYVRLDHIMSGLVYDPDPPPEYRISVTVGALDHLEVSSLYDGSFKPDTHNYRHYWKGAPLEGEEWIPVDLDAVKAREPAACQR